MNKDTTRKKVDPVFLIFSVTAGLVSILSTHMMDNLIRCNYGPETIREPILYFRSADLFIFAAATLLTYFISGLIYRKIKVCKTEKRNRRQVRKITTVSVIVDTAVMLVWYLAHYPGTAMNDSINALIWPYIHDAQPIFYQEMLYHLFWFLNSFFSSSTLAFGVIAFLQMALFVLVINCIVHYMASCDLPDIPLYIIILFYAFFPAFGDYSSTIVKDSLFSIGMLGFVMLIYRAVRTKGKSLRSVSDILLFTLCTLIVSFTRTNGFWTAVVVLFILLFLLPAKQKIITCCLLAILPVLHIAENSLWEANSGKRQIFCEGMSIQISMISAVIYMNETIDDDSLMTLNRILPIANWKSSYMINDVDGIKYNEAFNKQYMQQHQDAFIKAWKSAFKNNPSLCIKAYLYLTFGNWSTDVRTGSFYNETQSYFKKVLNNFGRSSTWGQFLLDQGLVNKPVIHGQESVLQRAFESAYVFTPGMSAFIILYLLILFIRTGSRSGMAAVLPAVLVWLSYMAAMPASCMYRYYLYIFILLPFYFGIAFLECQERAVESEN